MLPREKQYIPAAGTFCSGNQLNFSIVPDGFGKIVRALCEAFSARAAVTYTFGETYADIRFCRITAMPSEHYEMDVTETGVTLRFGDLLGCRNATVTFLLSLREEDGNFSIPCGKTVDYPDFPWRGALLDLARKYVPIADLKAQIRQMAFAKMNRVHLHLNDTKHYAIRSEALPELQESRMRQYSLAEMKELVEYAEALGVTVMPELDFPAHSTHFLEVFPQFRCRVPGREAASYCACISNDEFYRTLRVMFEELLPIFPGPYYHIGGDEIEFRDLGKPELFCEWEDCENCRALAARRGYRDKSDLFCVYARRMAEMMKEMGKTPVLSSDAIDISRPVDLPREIVMDFWRVAAPGRGASNSGCSMERFAAAGFKVINNYYPETYFDFCVNESALMQFSPLSSPAVDPAFAKNVLGGEVSVWETYHHYGYTLPIGFTLFGDRYWSREPITDRADAEKRLSRTLFGPSGSAPDFFTEIDMLLPDLKSNDPFGGLPEELLRKLEKELSDCYYGGFGETAFYRELLWCVRTALKK